ncbi:unnamed protein product, partial [Tetraodon nigroviridis]
GPESSVSTSYSVSTLSPTKAAVDSLMSIGQSLLQQGFGGEQLLHGNSAHLMADIKTEMMQVDMGGNGHDSSPNMESSASSNGERAEDRARDGPGTPTRSSVITSARELHYRLRGAPAPDLHPEGVLQQAGRAGQRLKAEGRNQHERCNVCNAELPDSEAVEQHR